MYSTLGVNPNSKHSGELIGTHQKLDKSARWLLNKHLPIAQKKFPSIDEILYFEGIRGPDGLKRKSPGVDEPEHFIQPGKDDGVLIGYIRDHHYNLVEALKSGNKERAAFEAAWMAHAITDGLTPAHHYPYRKVVDELMSDKDYKKLFGVEVKGIMRGDNLTQAARNNWLYWGAGGVMTKHIAFEYGVAYTISQIPMKRLAPKNIKNDEYKNPDYEKVFYTALDRVAALNMYDRFLQKGWNTELIVETREKLIPEIIRAISLAWASAILEANKDGK
ncbi:hypothetical protein IKP94_02395 [Candidatus Saccharibacteria bacterium]|nr:hypothetical protein [Candidatus Saccharibacteria bacterium]